MELKYIDEDNITVNGYSSNRTFMELKLQVNEIVALVSRYNRD